MVGSTPAHLTYAGLAGSFVGLYEFYITVPARTATTRSTWLKTGPRFLKPPS